MATRTVSAGAQSASRARPIPVRTITGSDLRASLKDGFNDFQAMRGDIVLAGIIYTIVGVAAVVMTANQPLIPFLFPIVAGVGLLGPVAAVGFYEVARRRELGESSSWSHFFDFVKRPSADDIGTVAGLLLVIFAMWLLAAATLYAMLFGWGTPRSIVTFFTNILTTPSGWALILGGAAVGAVFGWVVLATSVVAMPMLVDCDISASQAVSTSWRAANANRGEMIRWGLSVMGLLVLGSIPLFVGLAFVLPWLGYSTWHLYTRLVDREKIPARRRRRD